MEGIYIYPLMHEFKSLFKDRGAQKFSLYLKKSEIKSSARRIKAVAAGGVTEAATASPVLCYEDITFAGEEMLTCVHRHISPTWFFRHPPPPALSLCHLLKRFFFSGWNCTQIPSNWKATWDPTLGSHWHGDACVQSQYAKQQKSEFIIGRSEM